MPSITIYKDVEVEVDVDLEDFEDNDILNELESRGLGMSFEGMDALKKIYELRRTNQPYDQLMDELIYNTLGRIL